VRTVIVAASAVLVVAVGVATAWPRPGRTASRIGFDRLHSVVYPLKVSRNGRYLVDPDSASRDHPGS
jgi:hypothetical protein